MNMRIRRIKFGIVAAVVQIVLAVLFAIFAEYDVSADPKSTPAQVMEVEHYRKYPAFQDIHVMIFVGFGFLMTFLKRYGLTAIGINMFLASLVIQWALLVRGAIYGDIFTGGKFYILLDEMITADFAAATVLISFGAVLGKTSPLQLLLMALIEVVVAQINGWVCHEKLHAVDVGESMYIHAFGCYFGLAVAGVLYNKEANPHEKTEACYHSDLFSFVGTIFLWLYWPSFNGGGAAFDEQHRAFINTYLSLCACVITTFAVCVLFDKHGKFTAEYVQNATLAGGVAVGTTANMPLEPWGAIVMGIVAGLISTSGYRFLSEWMAERLRIHDTCGVHNLHGMPAVLAAIAGAVMAALSSEEKWGRSMYEIFPYTAPLEGDTPEWRNFHGNFSDLDPGKGWSSGKQGTHQILALLITLGIAIVSGVITGFILKIPCLDQLYCGDDLYEDTLFWHVPDDQTLTKPEARKLEERRKKREEMYEKSHHSNDNSETENTNV